MTGKLTWTPDELARQLAVASLEIAGRFYRRLLQANPIAYLSPMVVPRHVAARIGAMVTERDETKD